MGKRTRRRHRQRQTQRDELRNAAAAASASTATAVSLDELGRLAQGRTITNRRIEDGVDDLAHVGVGWVLIAEALGVSRQAARQGHLRLHASSN